MAKYSKPAHNYKHTLIIFVIAVAVGIPIAVYSMLQQTQTQQHASTQFSDINTAFAINKTNNTDGTMGPMTFESNYSNTFPSTYMGTLDFQVTDPPQAHQNTNGKGSTEWSKNHPGKYNANTNSDSNKTLQPTSSDTGSTSTHNAKNITNTAQDGPQTVTSLFVTISKVEVHLAKVGLPGSTHTVNEAATVSSKINTSGQSNTAKGTNNQLIDKWETLNIKDPKTVDLVYLANSHNLSSLGLTTLANGLYTEVRLYVFSAYATLQGSESPVQLVVPGKGNIVRVVQPFVINSGKPTTLVLDFDAQNSVIKAGDQYILKPVIAHMTQKYTE
jgi:hypothetical protein